MKKNEVTIDQFITYFPNAFLSFNFFDTNKMHYLGYYQDSKCWAGNYKNGDPKLVIIDDHGSAEIDIII